MNQEIKGTATNPSRIQYLNFQRLKFAEINHDWRVGEITQRYVHSQKS